MARLPTRPAPAPVPVPDMVNHPPHYAAKDDSGIECAHAIRAMLGNEGYVAFLRGTILAYGWRLPHKDAALQDALKIEWYATELAKVLGELEPS